MPACCCACGRTLSISHHAPSTRFRTITLPLASPAEQATAALGHLLSFVCHAHVCVLRFLGAEQAAVRMDVAKSMATRIAYLCFDESVQSRDGNSRI
eukprot:332942-Rhodomonas_salina.2